MITERHLFTTPLLDPQTTPKKVLNKHDYVTGYHYRPDWADVMERVALLNLPEDPKARAHDIVQNFSRSGRDIQMLSYVLHQVLVPDYRTTEIDVAHTVVADGVEYERAHPEERDVLLTHAAELIRFHAEEMEQTENYSSFLERAGNVMGMAVVLSHHFADGNGRTSRFMAELVRNGSDSQRLKVAGTNRPSRCAQNTAYIPNDELSLSENLWVAGSPDLALSQHVEYTDRLLLTVTTPYAGV